MKDVFGMEDEMILILRWQMLSPNAFYVAL
jgi:hypothetical protein